MTALLAAAAPAVGWEYRLERRASGAVTCGTVASVSADPAGDVYAAGSLHDCVEGRGRPVVVKLDGDDGAEAWRREVIDGAFGECLRGPFQVAIDAAGTVALTGGTGTCYEDGNEYQGLAARLSPSGETLWLRNLTEGDAAMGALDADGNQVAAAGTTLLSLDAATGATHWSQAMARQPREIATDVAGRVLAAADAFDSIQVTAYAGATGDELWSTSAPAQVLGVRRLFPGPEFIVVVGGSTVSMLRANDGTPYWSRALPVDLVVGAVPGALGSALVGGYVYGGTNDPANLLLLYALDGGGYVSAQRQISAGSQGVASWLMRSDGGGCLLFVGSRGLLGTTLLKVTPDDYATRWEWSLDAGPLGGQPAGLTATTVTTDAADDVLIGGEAVYLGEPPDPREGGGVFTVVKRTGPTGASSPCGDGVIDAGEPCDDGNAVDGDGCDASCRPSGCGSGRVSGTEECDDGNTVSGDGCSAACTIEPGCGEIDVRGRWETTIQCALRDLYSPTGFPLYATTTLTLDLGEQCTTGTLEVRAPAACGTLQIDANPEVPLVCAPDSPLASGTVDAGGVFVTGGDGEPPFALATPLTPDACTPARMRLGPLTGHYELDRPGHARRLAGAADLTFVDRFGEACAVKHPTADFCFFGMKRLGPAAGSCELGCDDGDSCTSDACNTFGFCVHAAIEEGIEGQICRLRAEIADGGECSGERERARAARLLARLDLPRLLGAPPWWRRAEMRFVSRLRTKVVALTDAGRLSRRCGRALACGLRELRASLRDDLRA